MSIKNHKELIVWQKGMDLVIEIYRLTEKFPKSELMGLVSQMRRAAVSIVSNIAEGSRRHSFKENRQFMHLAFGSSAELETQLEIAKRLGFAGPDATIRADGLLDEVLRMLNKMTSMVSA